ncbi:hypothetical protein MWU49_11845 [Alcanivorax sp. S6407]|uniref:hypothetical protein n=1 Tax=Alcanivorax sp. S6407 TaxID=2926424 RepID=UPI001FF655DA|nr:hypothetical protein [Alcanivorax sp. S6407]MCK0154399.1 hypothetical protein [Alcanivorax sp. S6407]
MKAAYLALPALALMFAGCTYKYDTDYPMGLPADTESCPEDPPKMCTQDYRPVFGYGEEGGILGEFSNACMACAQDGVMYTSPKKEALPAPASAPEAAPE